MVSTNTTEEHSRHHIILDNIKSGEIVNHSLLICKGHIEHNPELKCNPLFDLLITTSHKDNISQTKINPSTNTFKFLINLKLGCNLIELTYCCSSTSFTLECKLRNTISCVVPLYIICKGHDGRFQAPETERNTCKSACKRIMTGCKLIQSIFAEKLHESGYGRKTFHLESSDCVIFHSKLHVERANKMGQVELWYHFAREIMTSSFASSDKKYLAFLSSTKYDGSKYSDSCREHSKLIKLTEGYVAFGGEGLALLGTACLFTWPESVMEIEERFKDESVVDRTKFLDDSCYRGTLGGCFATSLGATLHELCHTFDLGHTESGIMGRGFDNIQNVFLPNLKMERSGQISKRNIPKISSTNDIHKENDDIYWTKNCLALLSFHRWFNDYNVGRKCLLQYNADAKILKSTAGLRLIEIRRTSDEMVLQYWVFMDKVLKYSYQINDEINCEDQMIIVVEDNLGNILKQSFIK